MQEAAWLSPLHCFITLKLSEPRPSFTRPEPKSASRLPDPAGPEAEVNIPMWVFTNKSSPGSFPAKFGHLKLRKGQKFTPAQQLKHCCHSNIRALSRVCVCLCCFPHPRSHTESWSKPEQELPEPEQMTPPATFSSQQLIQHLQHGSSHQCSSWWSSSQIELSSQLCL